MRYILGIDQSTQGTKAILADEAGTMIGRADVPHRQIINEKGWVSHDPEEIYQNVKITVRKVVEQTGISREDICAMGISNQRETTAIWTRDGQACNDAVVWQCSRAAAIAERMQPYAELIREHTGIPLSPFFPAEKMAWLLKHTESIRDIPKEEICLGTMDSWLIYRLTNGSAFKTDYSNASRTQLFDLQTLGWNEKICGLFGIPLECLPEICDSNSCFGWTDLDGYLGKRIPIHGVAGDSHAALFGQGCHKIGMIKTTYGTGSSIMMNTGDTCVKSENGLVTSLAWGIDGAVTYVLEGNINYTGAVIEWLKDDLGLIRSPAETGAAAMAANPEDTTVLVPAFSGLSMPYWKTEAKASISGMTRLTGRNEIIRAALESIALQIEAVLEAMRKDSGFAIRELRVDGGPTGNAYLMQLQSDLSDVAVSVSQTEELSAMGAVLLAGLGCGLYSEVQLNGRKEKASYQPKLEPQIRKAKLERWQNAVAQV